MNTIEKLGLNVQSIIMSVSGQSLHLVYLLEIRSGSPALAVGRPDQPDKPPAGTASLEELHLLALSQPELPPRQRVVVGQHQVPAAVELVTSSSSYNLITLCFIYRVLGGHVRNNKLS